MKKTLLMLFAAVILFSCSHSDKIKEEPSGKLYPVKFETNLKFQLNETPLSKSDTIFQPDTSHYYNDTLPYHYMVYNSNGSFVKQIKGYGNTIHDSLPTGNYHFAIVGSDDIPHTYTPALNNYYYDSLYYYKAYHTSFSRRIDEYTQDSVIGVCLESIWNELFIEITDRATCGIPQNADSIIIQIEGVAPGFKVNSGEGCFYSYASGIIASFRAEEIRQPIYSNFTSYSSIGNNVNVSLIVHFNDATPPRKVLLASFPLKKNTRTILSGELHNSLTENSSGGSNYSTGLQLFRVNSLINETINF